MVTRVKKYVISRAEIIFPAGLPQPVCIHYAEAMLQAPYIVIYSASQGMSLRMSLA